VAGVAQTCRFLWCVDGQGADSTHNRRFAASGFAKYPEQDTRMEVCLVIYRQEVN
jgi:hypothetical protein